MEEDPVVPECEAITPDETVSAISPHVRDSLPARTVIRRLVGSFYGEVECLRRPSRRGRGLTDGPAHQRVVRGSSARRIRQRAGGRSRPLQRACEAPQQGGARKFRQPIMLWAWSTCPECRGPPLDGLIDDLYYLEGAPPYSRLTLPAGAGAVAHRQPRGAVPHPRRHRHRDGRVRRRLRGHHAHPRVGVRLPTPDPVRRRPLQAVGAGAVPADARGRAVRPAGDGGAGLGPARHC